MPLPEWRTTAETISSPWQRIVIFCALLSIPLIVVFFGIAAIMAFVAALTILCVLMLYKVILPVTATSSENRGDFTGIVTFTSNEIAGLDYKTLPTITVLIPLFKEGEIIRDGERRVIGPLVESLARLDYPSALLDIQFLLEKEDIETIEAIYRKRSQYGLNEHSRVQILEPSDPQTKPKACNVGLEKAWGEIVVIFDAEDKPETDQLKKAVLAFRKSSVKTVCIQGKLAYRNPDTNILTAMQAASYAAWFDFIMPGLAAWKTHVPLGGTSNYFKTSFLREVGGWDGFNVTEDHDMGVWIARLGYETAIMDSTTWEEANVHLGNFVRQQSRWLKGSFATYLVHMRNPWRLYRDLGLKKLLAFHVLTLLNPAMCAATPIFWMSFGVYVITKITGFSVGQLFIESLYQGPIYWIALFCMTIGTMTYVYVNMAAVMKRELYTIQLTVMLFSIPYGLLLGIAAWKALYQLIVKPHFWEKTNHGLDTSETEGMEEIGATVAAGAD
ncbi:MAG: glycosyltransferase [Dehalococcoidia bacterium]